MRKVKKGIYLTLNVSWLLGPDKYFRKCLFAGILTLSIGFTENCPNRRKYLVSGNFVNKNALLMSEVRGEGQVFEMTEWQQ